MALETLAAVSAALSQIFDEQFVRQYNRLAVAATLIQAERGQGKNGRLGRGVLGRAGRSVIEGS